MAIVQFDVNPARWHGACLDGKPNAVEVGRLSQRAESVEPLSALVIKIDPRARGLGVGPAGRQSRRSREEIRRVRVFVENVVAVTDELLASGLMGFGARQSGFGSGGALAERSVMNKTRMSGSSTSSALNDLEVMIEVSVCGLERLVLRILCRLRPMSTVLS